MDQGSAARTSLHDAPDESCWATYVPAPGTYCASFASRNPPFRISEYPGCSMMVRPVRRRRPARKNHGRLTVPGPPRAASLRAPWHVAAPWRHIPRPCWRIGGSIRRCARMQRHAPRRRWPVADRARRVTSPSSAHRSPSSAHRSLCKAHRSSCPAPGRERYVPPSSRGMPPRGSDVPDTKCRLPRLAWRPCSSACELPISVTRWPESSCDRYGR